MNLKASVSMIAMTACCHGSPPPDYPPSAHVNVLPNVLPRPAPSREPPFPPVALTLALFDEVSGLVGDIQVEPGAVRLPRPCDAACEKLWENELARQFRKILSNKPYLAELCEKRAYRDCMKAHAPARGAVEATYRLSFPPPEPPTAGSAKGPLLRMNLELTVVPNFAPTPAYLRSFMDPLIELYNNVITNTCYKLGGRPEPRKPRLEDIFKSSQPELGIPKDERGTLQRCIAP
jgi:hypothetical protein